MARLIFEGRQKVWTKKDEGVWWRGGDGDGGGGGGLILDGGHSSHLLPHMFTPLFPCFGGLVRTLVLDQVNTFDA